MFKVKHFCRCLSGVSISKTMATPLILKLISASIPIADFAGSIIRDVMKTGELNIVDKGIQDFQTQADRSAQQYIIGTLARQFPHITIIGEEGALDKSDETYKFSEIKFDPSVLEKICPVSLKDVTESQITVWVDPLDGTSEYTQGLLEHVTVLIGIAVDDKAVAGIIHQPYYGCNNESRINIGRTIWGLTDLGAYGFEIVAPPSDKHILTTTRSHSNKIVQAAINAIQPDEVLRVGGAGYKVLLLLEGKANAYVFASQGAKRWDTCAPEAILHAAGGLLTDINGKLYKYHKETEHLNKGGVLATAKESYHSYYLNLIPQEVKDSLK